MYSPASLQQPRGREGGEGGAAAEERPVAVLFEGVRDPETNVISGEWHAAYEMSASLYRSRAAPQTADRVVERAVRMVVPLRVCWVRDWCRVRTRRRGQASAVRLGSRTMGFTSCGAVRARSRMWSTAAHARAASHVRRTIRSRRGAGAPCGGLT